MQDMRIATVIFHSPAGQSEKSLEQMSIWAKQARAEGAVIICFPEMNVTGYSTGQDIIDSAEPVPGPIIHKLSSLAKSENITILAGIAEKAKNGRIFASHLVLKPNGEVGVYRKLHLAPPERSIFSPGDRVPLFEVEGVKFGIQLCYDAHFPELSTHMAIHGAEVIFMPHASPRGTPKQKYKSWMRHLPARAFDNGLFVIACNQTGENQKGLRFPGLAVILGPSGKIVDKDLSGSQRMIVTDLKSEDLSRVRKHKMRFFLPNRRPELYGGI
jgi:N-carbamoylputrescine amidase